METTVIISTLFRLAKVFDDMGKLLFKAHLDVPLTFDRAQSQALLRRNNRLEFSYQQLKTSKTKLLNQLLATAGADPYLWTTYRVNRRASWSCSSFSVLPISIASILYFQS